MRHLARQRKAQEDLLNRAQAENAIIEQVVCVNFMCHGRLTVNLGPHINFIIGHNGSGKSAVLSALTICLGGKAASTNRGQSLKTLIKEGCERATLSVKIKNQGLGSYKSDQYGASIIVERFFTRSGTSGYQLKSALGKVISRKRDDLDEIIDYYCLQLDNPMNVLSQDNARQFLNNSSPADKYKFFQKGTQLERLDADYRETESYFHRLQSYEQEILLQVKDLKLAYEDAKRNSSQIEWQRKLRMQKQEALHQFAWAQVEEREETLREIEVEIKARAREIEEHQQHFEEAAEQYQAALREVEDVRAELDAVKAELEPINEDIAENATQLAAKRAERLELVGQEREAMTEMENATKRATKVGDEIKQEEKRLEASRGNRPTEIRTALGRCRDETESQIDREKSLQAEIPQLKAQVTQVESTEQAESRAEIDQQKRKVESAKARLDQLQGGRVNQLSREGVLIASAIARENGFHQQPVGPVWKHVWLQKQEWSTILEQAFGPTLDAYCVTSKHDMSLLHRIFDRVYAGNNSARRPRIIVGQTNRINTNGNEPTEDVDTWLKVLKIDNDLVRNQLIIQHYIEKTVLIKDYQEATAFAHSRPHNTTQIFAFHEDQQKHRGRGWRMTPDPKYSFSPATAYRDPPRMQADTQAQIAHAQGNLEAERQLLQSLEQKSNQSKQALVQMKREIKVKELDLKKVKDSMRTLALEKETLEDELESLDGQGGDLQNMENDRRDHQAEMKRLDELITVNFFEAKNKAKNEEEEIKAQEKRLEKKKQRVEARIAAKQDDVHNTEKKGSNILEAKNAADAKKHATQRIKEEEEARREEQVELISTFTVDAENICPRVPVPVGATCDKLEEHYKKLEEDLKQAQQRVGGTEAELKERELKAKNEYEEKALAAEQCSDLIKTLFASLANRKARWKKFQQHISLRANTTFMYLLAERQFRGKLNILHDEKTLDLFVEPDITKQGAKGRQTKTLSGGEKSFSTICLLLALWDAMGSPIRCLDEFDVFMDSVNRDVSMRMMIGAARGATLRQFILITPQAMSNLVLGPDIRVHKMSDPERGQATLSLGQA
ncbi:P-loop containing nucleoside triphosphate hydrolase protein [Microthyrium microscopicum]|uniref:P-loop containing nucleoside triphosphate hydrolase protein n=1 Tax=Microthyrium microscopicum TaxID=703497 RepID=A0A6A6U352_9PEZI|nr:P-loop containing nucleoside triphosphate hydrolase protein [Microthyrium microscopicum]